MSLTLTPSDLEEKFLLTLPDKTQYIATVRSTSISIIYYFGSATQTCIRVQIFLHDIHNGKQNIATIHQIDSPLISVNRDNLSDDEDRYNLCCLVFSFICSRHPNIVSFKYRHHLSHSKKIHIQYLRDGQTWVMRRLCPRIPTEDEERLRVADIESRKTIPWALMKGYMHTGFSLSDSDVEQLYETSATMLQFFRSLYIRIGEKEFIDRLTIWIYDIIGTDTYQINFYLLSIDYTIDASKHSIIFTQKPI